MPSRSPSPSPWPSPSPSPSQDLEKVSDSRTSAIQVRRTLHQFPRSHFCEKTRWHLDIKGLDYAVRNLFPGIHGRINRRLVGQSSVPLLIDSGRAIHDSSVIALYLEATYGGRRLLPDDDGLRSLALAMEGYFDSTVGPAVRHWLYAHLLPSKGTATTLFFGGYKRSVRWASKLMRPFFERELASQFPRDEASVASVESAMIEGMERLENTTERDPDRFLVGESLSLADVTAAALFAPIIGPPNSPWGGTDHLTTPILKMRERLSRRPGGQWVLRRYQRDREGSIAVASAG